MTDRSVKHATFVIERTYDAAPVHFFDSRYNDIVENERIIYTYDMYIGEERMSVSIATVETEETGAGTHMTYTEQGAFLDGLDTPEQREAGTREMLDALGAALPIATSP